MAACRFVITDMGTKNNLRGQPMVLIRLTALECEPLEPPKPPKGVTKAPPEGHAEILVSEAFAKSLTRGDEMALELR